MHGTIVGVETWPAFAGTLPAALLDKVLLAWTTPSLPESTEVVAPSTTAVAGVWVSMLSGAFCCTVGKGAGLVWDSKYELPPTSNNAAQPAATTT